MAVRRLRKSPGFTAAAIVTLALGIGANTAVFTAVNALVFRPLPVDRPQDLVFLNLRSFKTEVPVQSYLNYLDFRDRNQVLRGLAGYRMAPVSLSVAEGKNARIWSYEVTGNYFDLLGVGALRGRVLDAGDGRTRLGHPVAVISYTCWQRRFNGDPEIAGRRIKLNGLDYTVVSSARSSNPTVRTPPSWRVRHCRRSRWWRCCGAPFWNWTRRYRSTRPAA